MKPFTRTIRVLVCLLILFGVASSSAAQQLPTGEIAAGWRLLHVPNSFEEGDPQTLPLGWFADVSGNLNRVFSVVGEISGSYKTFEESFTEAGVSLNVTAELNVHTFLGGVRFSARQNPKFVPFAQVLFGIARGSATLEGQATVAGRTETITESESSSDFAVDIGGGVNVPLTERLGLRVGASYLRIGGSDGGNAFRFGVGGVFPF
jgi:opacity protein-like surface antigen